MRLRTVVIHACFCQIAILGIQIDRYMHTHSRVLNRRTHRNYWKELRLRISTFVDLYCAYLMYFLNMMIKTRGKVTRVISKLKIYSEQNTTDAIVKYTDVY